MRAEAATAQQVSPTGGAGLPKKKYKPSPKSKLSFKQAKDYLNKILRAAQKCDPAKLCPNGPPGAPQSASQCGTVNK